VSVQGSANPNITAVRYDGALTVSAQWTPSAGGPNYVVAVLDGTTVIAQGNAFGVQGNVALTRALPQGSSYTVAAAASGTPSQWGNGMIILVGTLTDLSATYDGGLELETSWKLPTDGLSNGASVAVIDTAKRTVVATANLLDTAGSVTLPSRLDPLGSYAVQARAAVATSTGPPSTIPLVTVAPALSALEYDGASTVDVVLKPPVPPNCLPSAVLLADGRPVASKVGSVGMAVVLHPAARLDATVAWTVRPYWMLGTARGPYGAPVDVPVARPTIREVRWEGDKLVLDWENNPGPPYPTGAQIEVTAPGESTRGSVSPNATHHAFVPNPALLPGSTYTATVAALRGVAQGPSGTGVPLVVLDPPKLTALVREDTALTATWTAPSRPAKIDDYVVTVRDGIVVVARAVVAGTSATVALPPVAGGARTVTVAARAGGSLGPETVALPVPATGPPPAFVFVAPITREATVGWEPADGATGYLVQAYRSGRPAGKPVSAAASATSVGLTTNNPAAYDDFEVALAVQAKDTTGTVATTTAFGPRLRVPTEPPVIRDVDFDGATVRVSWDPVPGVRGYSLSALASGPPKEIGHTDVDGGRTSARFKVALADNLSPPYQVVVEPVTAAGHGVGAYAPLFAPGLYVRPATAATTNPVAPALPARIVRATTPALAPSAVTAYLPDLGPLTGLPIKPAQSGASDFPFTLEAVGGQSPPLEYKLTIDNGALRFDPGRATLAATYGELLAMAESNGATPQGILAIQQATARLMPQTFDETLFYSYGLDAVAGCVDLRPGMVLRVGFSSFDLTAVSGAEKWSSGYTGGPVVDYDVGDVTAGGGWRVGFDAFVDWLVANGALTVPAPSGDPPQPHAVDVVESGGADAADLSFSRFQQPFYRLFVPGALQAATDAAVSRTSQQFTIAAAPSWHQLETASPLPGGGVSLAYFRGRAVVRPCVRVEVDETEHVVPVGTTVGNVLDRLARRPPPAALALRGMRLERASGPAVVDPASGYRADALQRVHLDWNGVVTWPGGDALSLPLLHGDRIAFGEP
jgi:hypothetical protein